METIERQLFTVKQFAKKNAISGTWPNSEHAIWAIRADSPKNGFGKVFVKIGRRVLIDVDKWNEAISNLQEKK